MDKSMDYYEFKRSFKSDEEWEVAYANLPEEEARRLILGCKDSSYLSQTCMISAWRNLHNKYFNKFTEDKNPRIAEFCKHIDVFYDDMTLDEYKQVIKYALTESSWQYTEKQAEERIRLSENYILAAYEAKDTPDDTCAEVGFGCG